MPVFAPLDDQVLVRRIGAVEMVGRLHVPDRAKEKPLEGVVVAVGPGRMVRGLPTAALAELEQFAPPPNAADVDWSDRPSGSRWAPLVDIERRRWTALLEVLGTAVGERRIPCQVQPGDRVLFRKYGGTEMQFDDTDCIVVRENEILGVIADDAPPPRRRNEGYAEALASGRVTEQNLDRELDADPPRAA